MQLSFNFIINKKQEKTMENEVIKLSEKTVVSLNLSADYTPKDVENDVYLFVNLLFILMLQR